MSTDGTRAQEDGAPAPQSGVPDLKNILLPKKEGGSSAISAERTSAAKVLEVAASIPTPEPVAAAQTAGPAVSPARATAVSSIHTYRTDVEDTVRGKHMSLADMMAAQARRAAQEPAVQEETRRIDRRYIAAGILFVLAAIAAGYVVMRLIPQTPAAPTSVATPYLYVDATDAVAVGDTETHDSIMAALQTKKTGIALPLGLVGRLEPVYPAQNGQSVATGLSAQQFLPLLAPTAPDSLVRSLSPRIVLGIHVFDGNQAFLVMKTDSYQQTFAGMLAWEPTMQNDLMPLFDRAPRPHIPEEGNTAAQAITAPQLLSTPFSDRIVENHDARVIQNDAGDILLVWTFIDRNTLIITTNAYTLREVISRLSQASTLSASAGQ